MTTDPAIPGDRWPAGDPSAVERAVTVDGKRVRIVEAGQAKAPTVVLLHGWAASAYNYRAILPLLSEAGLRAIAPDLPGHGWSDAPASASSPSTARWVESLLDALAIERCVLVGQSIGGAVALDAAALMRGRVRATVLLAPIGFTPVHRVDLARALGFRWWHPPVAPRWMVAAIVRRIYGTRGHWTSRDVDEYWLPLRRREVVSAIMQSLAEFDFGPRDPARLAGIGTVVIRLGELDRLISRERAIRHAALLEGADVAVLPGVGHVPAEEVPDEIAATIVRLAQAQGAGQV